MELQAHVADFKSDPSPNAPNCTKPHHNAYIYIYQRSMKDILLH